MGARRQKVRTLMDFSTVADAQWRAINDGVMGGQSEGGPQISQRRLHFSGSISLANNGGFSSIRAPMHSCDLSEATGLLLCTRGDGRTYQLRLYTDACCSSAKIAYAIAFTAPVGEWTELPLAFSQLQPTFRGQTLSGPAFEASKVEQIGFLIADKRAGPFKLEVGWIKSIANG